jgi:uncharacterized protein YqeY
MALRDQLQADLKDAMKSGDAVRKTTIRGIMTSLNESEQRKREDLAKKALKKHNVAKPTNSDESTLAAYQQAVDGAFAAENVEDAGKLDEMEAITVLQKLANQRQESIDQASQAGRTDIAEAESVELSIVEAYLPRQMSREELEAEVRAVIAEVGATELRDMGKVMSPLMERLQGRADGKQVSEVVRLLLAQ